MQGDDNLFILFSLFFTGKSLNQTKKPISKSEQSNKHSAIDDSIGFTRTHIDYKKLEDEQRKKATWREIENFVKSDNDKSDVKTNRIQTFTTQPSHSTSNRWNKLPKINSRNDLNPIYGGNSKSNYNHNNNINNYINQNSHLNKRKFEGISTSGSAEPNSVMTQLHHLQKLLTKLLTRKSTKKRSDKSIKLFNETANHLDQDDIQINEIDDNDNQDEMLANNIVENLLLTDTGIKNLIFDWVISDWSSCSVSHGTGFQVIVKKKKSFLMMKYRTN